MSKNKPSKQNLIFNKRKSSEYKHMLYLGETGEGKSRYIVVPALEKQPKHQEKEEDAKNEKK